MRHSSLPLQLRLPVLGDIRTASCTVVVRFFFMIPFIFRDMSKSGHSKTLYCKSRFCEACTIDKGSKADGPLYSKTSKRPQWARREDGHHAPRSTSGTFRRWRSEFHFISHRSRRTMMGSPLVL